MFEQKINADTILGLLNSKVLQYYKVSVDHVLFWVFKCSLAHPNPYSFFFMKISPLERETGVFELLLRNGNSATLGSLGFPSIKSHEHEWLQVTLEPISRFCSYW